MPLDTHILIVEDHPLYRDALARVLSGAHGTRRCSGAAGEDEALALLEQHPDIDLVIADWRLTQGNGLALLEAIGRRWPTVARVLLSGTDEQSLPARARRIGLMAYLPKTLEPHDIAAVVERVLAGELCLRSDAAAPPNALLTPRQARVLSCVAAGQANKHIARTLGVSERTIKYHLEAAYARLAVSNRAEAVACALERGLISAAR